MSRRTRRTRRAANSPVRSAQRPSTSPGPVAAPSTAAAARGCPVEAALDAATAQCVARPAATVGVPLLLLTETCLVTALSADQDVFRHTSISREYAAICGDRLRRFAHGLPFLPAGAEQIRAVLDAYRAPGSDNILDALPPAAAAVLLGGSAWAVPGAEELTGFLEHRAPGLTSATLLTASLARLRAPEAPVLLLAPSNAAVAAALTEYVAERYGACGWESATREGARRWNFAAARELAGLAAGAFAYHAVGPRIGAPQESTPLETDDLHSPGHAVAFAIVTSATLTADTGFIPALADRHLVREALEDAIRATECPGWHTGDLTADLSNELLQ